MTQKCCNFNRKFKIKPIEFIVIKTEFTTNFSKHSIQNQTLFNLINYLK